MNEPYRIRTAVAPDPLSRDEVAEYFENLERRRAVNPERNSARIMKAVIKREQGDACI
jgi:hypothetical protein